ncbi:MAG: 16S rRNA (cytidine(1402)-2'-O)-methyltransferase [Marinicella sp.]
MINTSETTAGTLYVVATPIGNLQDITFRAVEVLQHCIWAACEDTRHSKRLFQAYNINCKQIALHQHNENQSAKNIIKLLLNGDDVALVSDAGTPLISDPGFPLVLLAHEHGIKVSPIPGPSALIAFLSVSAVKSQPFTFHGFLPAKKQQRLHFYQSLLPLNNTHVFYESSHRIVDSLEQVREVFGDDITVAMGRELTKQFEQIFRGTIVDLLELLQSDNNHQKGEFVIAIEAHKQKNDDNLNPAQQQLAQNLMPYLPPKTAAKIVADQFNINKKKVYEYILSCR